ncbi:ArsR family transcriptional regulator [Ktedonosporobacter rubrisoli]|uniref:ArsR family transcriptional regulator n=1 Tax=Ktedonosporobacter rubrisoli TaxID=2509675 RepID=A0A4P6JKF6_KTERU|nr:helix-turn-helix domain-containing protein [Ktedonosporobacter rubrisoli]QBD75648.1 ArsR family transcriptional regulator [Ktedonosporobacter rubrisoli]
MMEIEERVFTALADTTRRQLISTLAQSSPKTATQLAREFPISRQGILKHLDLLAQAGLVRVQTSGREKRFILDPTSLQAASTWIETIGKQWDERLQRLKTLLEDENI